MFLKSILLPQKRLPVLILIVIVIVIGLFFYYKQHHSELSTSQDSTLTKISSAPMQVDTNFNSAIEIIDSPSDEKIISVTSEEQLYVGMGEEVHFFHDTPIGQQLTEIFILMDTIGIDSENNLELALEELENNRENATEALLVAYKEHPDANFIEKYKTLFTLSEISTLQAKPFLLRIIDTPYTSQEVGVEHQSDLLQQRHEILRMAALSGILNLANEDPSIRPELQRIALESDSVTLREMASLKD